MNTRLALLSGLLAASSAWAGGWFMLIVGQASASSDPAAQNAAFTLQVYGCSANSVRVTATAEGLVEGRRLSVPLEPVRLAGGNDQVRFRPGTQYVEDWPNFRFAIPKAWPASQTGAWVVRVESDAGWIRKSALVVLGPDGGVDRRVTALGEGVRKDEVERELLRISRSGS